MSMLLQHNFQNQDMEAIYMLKKMWYTLMHMLGNITQP